MMRPLTFHLHAAAVMAPGLTSLEELRSACRGELTIVPQPLALPGPTELPAAERRRASGAVRLALACIAQAVNASPFDPARLRAVFATDEGTGEVCQQMLEALSTTRQLSPLLFANSVHNAPSGYFSIGWRNQLPSSVVSLGLDSFACGLVCAVTDALATAQPVLMTVIDPALPAPLDELLPITHGTAAAFVISAEAGEAPPLASFELVLQDSVDTAPTRLPAWLPAAWHANSSAQALSALRLLEEPEDTALQFSFGHQLLVLRKRGIP